MRSNFIQNCWLCAIAIVIVSTPTFCFGQTRVNLPAYPGNPWVANQPPTGYFPPAGSAPPVYTTPPGAATFDPYAYTTPGFRPNTSPYVASPNWNLGNLFSWNQPVQPLGTGAGYPLPNQPIGMPNPYGMPAQPMSTPYPPGVYPNANPNVLFPSTGGTQPLNSTWNFQNPNPYGMPPNYYNYSNSSWNNWWNSAGTNLNAGTNQVIRLFQGPRFRHTWLPGTGNFDSKEQNSIETNDTDVSLVFAIPNFLGSTRPLYIIPSYSQHEWDGPSVVGSDLPGSAFSAFLDTGWETNPIQTLGLELGFRIGVFSAFDAVNSESIRYQGKALGRLRLTPTATLRAGVFYIDRNKIKLLPAVGLLWTPNPDTRFDLFFPEPKLSHYLATMGNADVWWYLTGYYGGGAWTIKQTDDANDEIDINDIRLMLGLEFGRSEQMRQGFRLGFVEGGYAFNRELLYRVRSTSNLDLENSFVLRAGFAY